MTSDLLILEQVMADEQRSTSETVRLASELVEMARVVCFNTRQSTSGKRMKLTQYLDNLLRPLISKDYDEVQARLAQEAKKNKGKRGE